MAGTNEFAFYRCKSICTGGGGPESGRKKFEKCLPAGNRYKNLLFLLGTYGAAPRSGEGVVRRDGRPKGCFGESVSSLPTYGFHLRWAKSPIANR